MVSKSFWFAAAFGLSLAAGGSARAQSAPVNCPNQGSILQAGGESGWDAFTLGVSCDSYTFSYGGFTWTNTGEGDKCPIIVYTPECKSQVSKNGYYTKEKEKPKLAWIFQCECMSSVLGVCIDYECHDSNSNTPIVIEFKLCFEEYMCAKYGWVDLPVIPKESPPPTTGAPRGPKGPFTGAPQGPMPPSPSPPIGRGQEPK